MKMVRSIYNWMGAKVHAPHALFWLGGFFFIEAFCFPIPVDPLLILFCVENSRKSLRYASIATISSVAGGIFGYGIGALLWNSIGTTLISLVVSPATFAATRLRFELYQAPAVLVAGFTPVPYKAVTLCAGFCHLPVMPFVIYSILARGARFFLVAGAIKMWGPQIKVFIDRYFNQLVVLFAVIVALCVWILT